MKRAEAQLIHELRNAAAVIRGAAVQLHDNYDALSPGMQRRLAEMVARRSDLLVRLIDDLSVVHQVDRGDLTVALQRVDLAALVRSALGERTASPGVRVVLELAEDAAVLGDPLRLTQIFENLLSNSIRYGGTEVRVRVTRQTRTCLLEVIDNGPGVSAEILDTLFEPYVRGPESNRVGGSGLGLAIVRELCRAQGGTVRYRPTDGEGAHFTVELPGVEQLRSEPGPDVADEGHTVSFWQQQDELARSMGDYTAHGLSRGEAVVVACTGEHHGWLRAHLEHLGVDYDAAVARGQLVPVDASQMHRELRHGRHIDPARFEELIGGTLERVRSRWAGVRAFGEIVDLYWREGEGALAVELETCWDALRGRAPFPLLCAYQLGADEVAGVLCDCHDAVVAA